MAEAVVSRAARGLRALRDVVVHNLPLKLLALGIAVGLWAFVNFGERDTEEGLKVPVELRQIPASLMITSPRIDFVDLRVVGPRTLLGRIDHNQLAIPLDLGGALPGPAVFSVNVDRLNFPRGVRVVRVTPAQITVTLDRIGRRVVPVELRLEGDPPEDFRVVASGVDPIEVEITGPEPLVETIEWVETDLVLLGPESRESIEREVALEPLGEYVTMRPSQVLVQVAIEEVQVEREFATVPIAIAATTKGEVLVEPEVARVVVIGPRRLVEPIVPERLLTVDATGLSFGQHIVLLEPDVPEGVTLSELEPEEVSVRLMEPTPPPTDNAEEMRTQGGLRPTPGDAG